MREWANRVWFWVRVVLVVGAVLYSIYYQFENPELTQTQLFLRLWWLSGAALVVFASFWRDFG